MKIRHPMRLHQPVLIYRDVKKCVLTIHEYSECLVSFWYCSRCTATVDTVGCTSGIGRFNETLV